MTKAEKSRQLYNSFNALKELTGALGEYDTIQSGNTTEGHVSAIIWWNVKDNVNRVKTIKEAYPKVGIVLEEVPAASGPKWNRVTILFNY